MYVVGLGCPPTDKGPRVVSLGAKEVEQALGRLAPHDKFADIVFAALRRLSLAWSGR